MIHLFAILALSMSGAVNLSGSLNCGSPNGSPILSTFPINSPEKIAQGTNGVFYYPYGISPLSAARIGVWTSFQDFAYVSIPNFNTLRNPHLVAFADRLLLTDPSPFSTNRVLEFQVSGTNFTLIVEQGINLDGRADSCVVGGRAYSFGFTGTTNNQNLIGCLMRNTNGSYTSTTTLVPAPGSIVNARLWTCVGFNGEAWLFGSQDGSQALSLYRFGASGTMTYTNSAFILPNQNYLSVSTELPIPTSIVDTDNNRILLGYCSAPSDLTCATFGQIAGQSSVTSVSTSGTLTLLGTTPWFSYHFHYPLVCMFPHAPSIDVISENVTIDGCDPCAYEFDISTLQSGTFGPTTVITAGGCAADVVGSHASGWIVYRGADSGYRLGKL